MRLLEVFGEIINPQNITYLSENIHNSTNKPYTVIYFNAVAASAVGDTYEPYVSIPERTKLEVMEAINDQM